MLYGGGYLGLSLASNIPFPLQAIKTNTSLC